MKEIYQEKPEKWDRKKAERFAKTTTKDAYGTKEPYPGLIKSGAVGGYGTTIYNGGCIRDGKWYDGEQRSLPQVPSDFEWITKPTWGWQLVKKSK